MATGVLEEQFSDRQVIVLTHDRDWYTELRHQLPQNRWQFKVLLPYENPKIGIRLSAKTATFDDARQHLDTAPDSAGNAARKIMEVELAIAAERLKIKMPYLHREHNDHRGPHDFLSAMISQGSKAFQKKNDKGYETNAAAIDGFKRADGFLLSWANRDSHTADSVKREAKMLIEVCEAVIDSLNCQGCEREVFKADDVKAEETQCGCGTLRWRYGKN